ncbi:hypothetical protein OESDEN_09111 [Oesophagostomum dentatum]|uniref:Uncharacterized protein n=1 Tax=Oesophagostomum dentatum TaxID=61180 RepID=A0A0B1T1B3_OESDE|nr:hypothetical protein OESDEN_09111 [Oesophagostomum dentatum]
MFQIVCSQIFSLLSKSKYLEKLPRFPIFCCELDSSSNNWCLIVEERFALDCSLSDLRSRSSLSNPKVSAPNISPVSDALPLLRHDPLRINSRFSWLRRKSTNGTVTPKSSVYSDSCRTPQPCPDDHAPLTFPAEENLDIIVDFVMERERLKSTLHEQGLFDGFLYRFCLTF